MQNPASVTENDTHKLLWDFGIQTDPLILVRIPDLIIINNKKKREFAKNIDLTAPDDHRITLKEIEKKDKYLGHARRSKKKN